MKHRLLLTLAALLAFSPLAHAQQEDDPNAGLPEFAPICDSIKSFMLPRAWVEKPIYVDNVTYRSRSQTLQVTFCRELATYPFREGDIRHIYAIVRENLPEQWRSRSGKISIISNKRELKEFHTDYFDGNREPVREHLRINSCCTCATPLPN